ncbi:hypothetical protein PG997_009230 [Apiospora hydei]|uniref:MYND-type domain-containing protein n=1 Tax=Apiospora hydei TaxID=1337664 RepID=A0ABR1VTM2_9PEZI
MGTDEVGSCITCEKADSQRCGRCKSAFYCSKACQVRDWPFHKLLCASFGAFDISTRPTSDHFLAISFPPEDKRPKPIWVYCPLHVDDLRPYQSPDLEDTIQIAWKDEYLVDGSIPNKGILSIMHFEPGRRHNWRGPVTAYGAVGLGTDQTHCRDLDMNDFRHITDFFLWYGDWSNIPTYTQQPSTTLQHEAPKIKGVMINCIGDQIMFHKPQFEAIDVSPSDPVFSDGEGSEIAQRIGLPVLTRRFPVDPEWARGERDNLFKENPALNQAATFMYQCCDPTAEFDPDSGIMGWGWVPMRWQSCARSVLVVRRDKKPLFLFQAEALSKYCQYEVRPLMSTRRDSTWMSR